MSNEKLARQWAERAKNSKYFDEYADDAAAAVEHVLATTTPLTMADVEWDVEKHHLAGATLPNGEEVVMMWPDTYGTGHIIAKEGEWRRDQLTPNGKRYELREIGAPADPAHPATLVTQEDYENAPEGTIVARGDYAPYVKRGPNAWTTEYSSLAYDEDMANTARQVLRKGWGKDGEPSEPTVSSNENVGPDQPEHPATLNTMVDYDSAPEGTIVLDGYEDPWVKRENLWCMRNLKATSEDMARWNDLEVVRWGWGK